MRVKRGGGGGFEASLSLWFPVLVESALDRRREGRERERKRREEGKKGREGTHRRNSRRRGDRSGGRQKEK